MIVVFEGPDGVGKTTLAKKVAARKDWHYTHSGRPTSIYDIQRTLTELEDLALSKKIYLVDRHPGISDIVYSKALDRTLLTSLEELVKSWQQMSFVVFCVAPVNDYKIDEGFKAHKPKEHLYHVKEQHDKIKQLYEDFFRSKKPFPWRRTNTRDDMDIDRMVQQIEQTIGGF